MLSIGKLTPGRASYYAEQLPGGADEYYQRDPTAVPAAWLGSAAGRLDLDGGVDPEAFRRLLDARHPGTGAPLGVPRTTDHRLAGFDLCFSAPKSVSVAWALAPPDTAEAIAGAHDRAVAQAVSVLETEVVRARRGTRAATLVETEGVVAAAFGHRSSRAGDPQIHTHVVVPNLTVTSDGRWSALAGDRVYRWAKTLGYLYQAALRAELTRTLGAEWGPVRNGAADLAGTDPHLLEEFSTRRAQITAAMERTGGASRQAAEIAALATRPAKDTTTDLASLRQHWADRASALRLDPPALQPGQGRPVPDRSADLAERMAAPDGLTSHSSTFDRRHVLQALAAGHPDGIDTPAALAAADAFLDRPDVVTLDAGHRGGPLYSTAELLEIETRLIDSAARRAATSRAAAVDGHIVARVLAARASLTDEQAAMVGSLTTSGAPVEVVVGRAGTGKTFALDAARAAWEAAGCHVIGTALAARAAAELEAGSGIASTTIDRLLADLDRPGPLSALPPQSVIVVDEAAMVGTRKLARLAAHAERAHAKLVLAGDHRQLPEIEAGGAYAALARTVPVNELTANRRQVEPWERAALAELRSGSVPDALDAYHRAGRIHLAGTAADARASMVADWFAAHRRGERAAMYALRRADVDDLNQRARAHLDAEGRLGPDRLTAAGREYATGEEVICLRNDRRLGVRNGTRSTVTAVDNTNRSVTLADGTVLPARYLDDGHVGHAYATTLHKAQGATVGRAFLLGSDTLYREAGYVGLSRARAASHLYIVAPETSGPDRDPADRPDPLADTIRRLATSRAQTLAADHIAAPGPAPARGPSRMPGISARRELLADPPAWLVATLGPPPATPEARARWARHAERLDAYRDIYQITDTAEPLGPRPDEAAQRRAWDLARLAIDEHHRSLELEQGLHL